MAAANGTLGPGLEGVSLTTEWAVELNQVRDSLSVAPRPWRWPRPSQPHTVGEAMRQPRALSYPAEQAAATSYQRNFPDVKVFRETVADFLSRVRLLEARSERAAGAPVIFCSGRRLLPSASADAIFERNAEFAEGSPARRAAAAAGRVDVPQLL